MSGGFNSARERDEFHIRRHARAKLAAAVTLLHLTSDDDLEEALARIYEAGAMVREVVVGRLRG